MVNWFGISTIIWRSPYVRLPKLEDQFIYSNKIRLLILSWGWNWVAIYVVGNIEVKSTFKWDEAFEFYAWFLWSDYRSHLSFSIGWSVNRLGLLGPFLGPLRCKNFLSSNHINLQLLLKLMVKVQVHVQADEWLFIKIRFSIHPPPPASQNSFKEARYSNISKTKVVSIH